MSISLEQKKRVDCLLSNWDKYKIYEVDDKFYWIVNGDGKGYEVNLGLISCTCGDQRKNYYSKLKGKSKDYIFCKHLLACAYLDKNKDKVEFTDIESLPELTWS